MTPNLSTRLQSCECTSELLSLVLSRWQILQYCQCCCFHLKQLSASKGRTKRTGQGESTSLVTAYDHEAMKFKRTP